MTIDGMIVIPEPEDVETIPGGDGVEGGRSEGLGMNVRSISGMVG